jgi:NADH-quinone oxidoreductase subunit H
MNFLYFDFLLTSKLVGSIIWMFWLTSIFILLSTALLTLMERKVMASVQRRRGPNVVGFFGLLQPFADGLKLALKETNVPFRANKLLFILGPLIAFFLAILGWAFLPFPSLLFLNSIEIQDLKIATDTDFLSFFVPGTSALDFDLGLLFVFVITSLHVYGVLIGGWSSNSRYALLGALRSTAQSISYELTMGFIILMIGIINESFNMTTIVFSQYFIWNIFSLFPIFIIFFICSLAELNRTPFDLVEAEGELVAGYFVEYSAMMFALYFLGEYVSIIFSSFVIAILFLGGWLFPIPILLSKFLIMPLSLSNFGLSFLLFTLAVIALSLKVLFLLLISLLVRFVLPRYRYDQLMYIGWTAFLPLCLALFIFIAVTFLYF